jgi:flagellar hook-associated protein 2
MITLNITPGSSNTGSGIDVTSVVEQILDAERAPEKLWQAQQTTLTQRTLALTTISSNLSTLKDKVNSLKDFLGTLTAKTATVSRPEILSATADASALPGNHIVIVNSLATTSSYYTDALATGSTPLGTGTLMLRVGASQPIDITVDGSNNTLDGLASYINRQDLGVTASVINDASGARLALISKTTGAPGDLTISGNVSGLIFHKSVTGTNASVTIDGVPVSSASNTISTALAGVTLNLVEAAPGAEIQLSVAQDTVRAKQAVNDFVASYNVVMAAIHAQFAVNPSTNAAGPLAADGTLRSLQASLLSDITYSISGNNGITSLASIGVSMANDGSLSVDDAKLTDVVTNHYSDFQSFFQTLGTGYAYRFSHDLSALTDSVNGPISLNLTEIRNTQSILTRQIADFEDRLAEREKQLILQYSRVDTMLRQFPLLMAQITGQLDVLSPK